MDASGRQNRAQTFHGSIHPFPRGLLGNAELGANIAKRAVFEKAEQYRCAVTLRKFAHGGIQMGQNLLGFRDGWRR